VTDIPAALGRVQARIAAAAVAAGRSPADVQLLAVSKLQPPEALRAAHAAGHRDFGENYAQELRDKAEALADLAGLKLHAIGALQTNKARYVAKHAASFHALDRLELAQELSRRCAALGRVLPCHVEVAIAGEAQKAGLAPEAVGGFLEACAGLPGIAVVGLMCIPPAADDPALTRPHFERLRALRDALQPQHPALVGLSMGMSHDFELAIACGATSVRVGTAIFGARP
jgi:hypothetical protein